MNTGDDDLDGWARDAGQEALIEDLAQSRAVAKLKAQLAEERRLRTAAAQRLELIEKQIEIVGALREQAIGHPPVRPLGKAQKGRSRGCALFSWSDLHFEERVDPRTINGLNEFNPDIAVERFRYLVDGVLWTLHHWRRSWEVRQAVIWIGGDVITGFIHEDNVESNYLSPSKATLLAKAELGMGLRRLLDEGDLEEIHVVCSYGNHGRTTSRKRANTAADNSWEWFLYKILEEQFSGEERMTWTVADGAHVYSTIFGSRIRFTHGDDVLYYGGVGGLTIPLRKACDAWDDFQDVDHTVLGHFHTFGDHGYALVNGSMLGYNAYALQAKCRWEPPKQMAVLFDEEWGKKSVMPIGCDPKRKVSKPQAWGLT